MFAFTIIWLVSVVAAIAIGTRIHWWLTWRLFFFVPLFGEIALLSPLANLERPLTLPMLSEPGTWGWIIVFYVYGMIQYGPIAVVLGGLGSSIIETKLSEMTISKSIFIFVAMLVGAGVGGSFQIVYGVLLGLRLHTIVWIRSGGWVLASIVGGATAGLIVAYYSAKWPTKKERIAANTVVSI
jgi:hypothetical protein